MLLFLAVAFGAATHGPDHGWLVIIGGGQIGPEVWDRFFALAGGKDQPIVLIPTANDAHQDKALETIRQAGATNLTVLHTRDRKMADSEAFVAPLHNARGVYFSGGWQRRLADAYLGTRTERELHALLDRGGVIGGSSAGASIMGSFLVGGGSRIKGMGFLTDSAINQHLLTRHREQRLVPVINQRPQLLGIGLDERTAIVVHGSQFEVIGPSKVAIYTAGHPYYFLQAGDRFDLAKRAVVTGR
jgi:cyanophycinase